MLKRYIWTGTNTWCFSKWSSNCNKVSLYSKVYECIHKSMEN